MRFKTRMCFGEYYVIDSPKDITFRDALASIVQDNLYSDSHGEVRVRIGDKNIILLEYKPKEEINYNPDIKQIVSDLNDKRVVDIRCDFGCNMQNINWCIYLANKNY